jgi:transposase
VLVKRHRDLAQLRNKHCCRLHGILLEVAAGGIGREISVAKACELLDRVTVADPATTCRVLIARELVDDIARLDHLLAASKKRIATQVAASGTTLTDIVGVGLIGAATIIGYTTDITRFPTKGHYATYNATAPIEASSDSRTRHRLNPRGNRILNHAIHIAAVTQLRHDTNGRVYYDRKRPQDRRRHDLQRSDPCVETTHLRRRVSNAPTRRCHQQTRGPGRTTTNAS